MSLSKDPTEEELADICARGTKHIARCLREHDEFVKALEAVMAAATASNATDCLNIASAALAKIRNDG
jgi:arsenate reductase-like glutaredoxin family protein